MVIKHISFSNVNAKYCNAQMIDSIALVSDQRKTHQSVIGFLKYYYCFFFLISWNRTAKAEIMYDAVFLCVQFNIDVHHYHTVTLRQ